MKIAVTFWNDRIAPVFDVSREIVVFDIDGTDIKHESNLSLSGSALEKISFLMANQVEVVLCGAIARPTYLSAEAQGLKVRAFLSGDVREVLRAYLENRLDDVDFVMPGCMNMQEGSGERLRKGRNRRMRFGGCKNVRKGGNNAKRRQNWT